MTEPAGEGLRVVPRAHLASEVKLRFFTPVRPGAWTIPDMNPTDGDDSSLL